MTRREQTLQSTHVVVKGNHFTVTADMRERATRKMERLQKYLDRLSTIEVELGEAKTRESSRRHRVEVTARASGRTLRVETHDDDVLVALDEAVDKLYRQLNRHKERLKSHASMKLGEFDSAMRNGFGYSLEPDGEGSRAPVIRVETVEMEPQFEDEALADMESQGRDVYMFMNAQTEQINVLYRNNGGFTLVQPE